jgi:integrase/recombinase XerD
MNQLAEQKRQFLKYLKEERGRSVKTIENYSRYLERFFTFAKVKRVGDLTEEQIREFRIYLNRQPGTKLGGRMEPMKRSTQNYHLIALRAFLNFLRKRGVGALSSECITLVKVPKSSIEGISSTDLKRLRCAPDIKTLEGMRDKAILELLLSTGLRVSDLCGLSVGDIDLSKKQLQVRNCGVKVRSIPFPDTTRACVQKYLKSRKDNDAALFVRYGRKMNDGGDRRISPRAVQRLIKHYAVVAGITGQVTPQRLRHSFATTLFEKGVGVAVAQELLGHKNSSTTEQYGRVFVHDLKE